MEKCFLVKKSDGKMLAILLIVRRLRVIFFWFSRKKVPINFADSEVEAKNIWKSPIFSQPK